MKNRCNFGIGKYRSKNRKKIGFGRVLGSIWEGFETVWGVFWALLDTFWLFFCWSKIIFFQSGLNMVPKWAPRGLQHRFWDDFENSQKPLASILGRFLKGLGKALEGFFGGGILTHVTSNRPCWGFSKVGPPRWSAKRHNARGSTPQREEPCTKILLLAFSQLKWSAGRGTRRPPEKISPLLLGGSWGHVGLIFRIFSHFLGFLSHLGFFHRSFWIFHRF